MNPERPSGNQRGKQFFSKEAAEVFAEEREAGRFSAYLCVGLRALCVDKFRENLRDRYRDCLSQAPLYRHDSSTTTGAQEMCWTTR